MGFTGKYAFLPYFLLLVSMIGVPVSCAPAHVEEHPACNPVEAVLREGDVITGTTTTGTIRITALSACKRQFEWEGNSREIVMWPRKVRWGKGARLGLYYPGPGYHWRRTNDKIRRAVVDESEVHFETHNDAMLWLETVSGWFPTIYNDEGLVLSFGKSPSRDQLDVGIYQILVAGKKPTGIPGSRNSSVTLVKFQGHVMADSRDADRNSLR